jgi:F-type H+-transporting ATPase subunit delta
MHPAGESLAEVYTQALMGLAADDAQAQELLDELGGVVGLLDEVDGFEELLVGAGATPRHRQELVDRIFAGRLSPLMDSFLGVLGGHNRMFLLRAIHRRLEVLLKRRRGQVDVRLVTAFALEPPQREAVLTSLRQALRAEPVLAATVDRRLLGGLVLYVGDRMMDASVSGQLRRLSRQLSDSLGSRAAQRIAREWES